LNDDRRDAPATARNREPILDVLRRALPAEGTVLEIASGTGQHATYFARALPALVWQPSDPDPAARRSIAAWAAAEGPLPNLRPPLELDVLRQPWPIGRADAVVAVNLLHISPRATSRALFGGAAEVLPAGGLLFVYGPFVERGRPTAPSNLAFDASLRERDAGWGLRVLEDLELEASGVGLALGEVVAMPSNNLSLLFRKRSVR
jgi:SAM-dependent methyltransferase